MECLSCGEEMVRNGTWVNKDQLTVQKYICMDCNEHGRIISEDEDVIAENVRLAKQKQALQDKSRIANKSFREYARVENAIEEYTKELVKVFSNNKLSSSSNKFKTNNKAVGVIQLSDIHFNELINLQDNKYDFSIASARLRHLITKATKYFTMHKITNVLVALTGDLMNSDRRLDELLNEATNRSQATFLAVDIMQQALRDLDSNFNVTVACVTGNEGRINKESGWSPIMATDNYDFTIFNMLKCVFKGSHITFIDGDPTELIVKVAGQNLLLMHGNCSVRHAALEKSINQIIGRYSMKGVAIDYVIMGHVHSASVGDNYSRSASLAGANDYSDKGLNLSSRASQNCYIFYEDGNRDGIKIDLQNTPSNSGYNIDESLSAYNTKGASKGKGHAVIMEIVI